MWNADNRNDEIRFRIGEKMKQVLELEPSTVIEYKHNSNSMLDNSSFKNAKPYVFTVEGNSAASSSSSGQGMEAAEK